MPGLRAYLGPGALSLIQKELVRMQRDCRVSAGTRLWKPRRKSSADGFGGSEDATGRRGSQGQGRVAQAIRLRTGDWPFQQKENQRACPGKVGPVQELPGSFSTLNHPVGCEAGD